MSEFKPMVKMMTTEPSVILKLKKGGGVNHKNAKSEEKEEHGHKSMQSHAMGGLNMAPEKGMAPKRPSMMARRAAMNPNLLMKKGGKAEKHEDAAQDRAMIKKALAGKKFANGGEIDKSETKTTIKGNANKFLQTKVVDGDKADKAHGSGKVKMGNAGGYANGGTISGNAGKFLNTKVVDGDKNDPAHGTGGVKMGNKGGYAKGGTVPEGHWENRPANTSKPGKSNTKTGEVKEANAGGYKHGGHASKKAYATGGNVNAMGKPVAMPKHFISQPVANSLQSGTFKKGGKVKKFDDGGSTSDDKYIVKDPKAVSDKASRELEEAMNPLSMAKELYGKAKNYFSPPAGSVPKTEKSVTVSPGKKRGGSAQC